VRPTKTTECRKISPEIHKENLPEVIQDCDIFSVRVKKPAMSFAARSGHSRGEAELPVARSMPGFS
jgi:hypothetical protein